MRVFYFFVILLFFILSPLFSYEELLLSNFESGASGWVLVYWDGSVKAQTNSNYSHTGSKSYKITYNTTAAWRNAGVGFRFNNITNISKYDYLRFYLRGEVTNTGRLNVAMYDDENNTQDFNYNADDYFAWTGGAVNHNFWKEYVIPLKPSFFVDGNADAGNNKVEFTKIERIDFYFDDPYQGCSGVVYLDDVMLVKDYDVVNKKNISGEYGEDVILSDFRSVFNLNDTLNFKIIPKEISDIELLITDFAGNVLIKKYYKNISNETSFNWDGAISGIKVEPGIYFVILNIKSLGKNKESRLTKKFYVIK